MKWQQMSILFLGVIVSLCGAVGSPSYAKTIQPSHQNEDAIIFEEELVYPEVVENALQDDILTQQSAKLVHHNDKAYIILSLGWRNNTGYSLNVSRAELKGNQLLVWAAVTRPAPGDFVAWVYWIPMKVISVPNNGAQVQHLTVIYN